MQLYYAMMVELQRPHGSLGVNYEIEVFYDVFGIDLCLFAFGGGR